MSARKVAIVTGANKGLGFAIVKILCEKYNGQVYLTSRDEKRGTAACEELKKLGLSPVYHQLDVTDNESIKKFLAHLRNKNEEVEILINNAGILFLNSPKPKIYQAEQTVFVNFTSLVNFTEAILEFVKKGAKIVNITSSSGHLSRIPSDELKKRFSSKDLSLKELKSLANSYVEDVRQGEDINKGWGNSPYVVSKVAVNAYTFMLHRRLASEGITVNCVHPGYVMSDMTYGAGSITPADAAVVPVSLALKESTGGRYVWHNGQDVPWDGEDPRKYIDGKNV
ncbi:carbonyl reductase [NADPH] 1-like [Anticarsia gemmatalis]|uniref:carbonyl reductase [NADPH] 1-like n=1 Tax=Anticarsia gemmatalis TaxID=129554 RepID=UPI003F76940F